MFKIKVGLLTPLKYTIQIHSPASTEAGVLWNSPFCSFVSDSHFYGGGFFFVGEIKILFFQLAVGDEFCMSCF